LSKFFICKEFFITGEILPKGNKSLSKGEGEKTYQNKLTIKANKKKNKSKIK
jgi:hypothetical protein